MKNQSARELLETVGKSFLTGFAAAAESGRPAAMADRLEAVPTRFRGFAYEGAAMGFAVMDGLPIGGTGRVSEFLNGSGEPHIYMAYVGVGWAMARLPRFRWRSLHAPDPMLRWLVLDGYGFHQAYFHTDRYVHRQYREPRFPWPSDDAHGYAGRAIDQGIGRAMWFVGGTDARVVAGMLDKFPESRRPDLYAGAGLAASYAGGADETELRWFSRHAGPYAPLVAQGAVFAASARVRAGLVVEHTRLAARVFCDMTPEQAVELSDRVLAQVTATPTPGEVPYETWRQQIAGAFAPAQK